jgi:hypothetical protein
MLDDPESGIFNLDTGEDNFSSEQAAKGADWLAKQFFRPGLTKDQIGLDESAEPDGLAH